MQIRRKYILWTILLSLALAALAGAMAAVTGDHEILLKVMLSSLICGGGAILIFPFSFLIDRERFRFLCFSAMGLVLGEALYGMFGIWLEPVLSWEQQERLGMAAGMLAMTGIPFVALAAISLWSPATFAARFGRCTCVLAYLLMLVSLCLPDFPYQNDEWFRLGWSLHGYGLVFVLVLLRARWLSLRWWQWSSFVLVVVAMAFIVSWLWGNHEAPRTVTILSCPIACIGLANLLSFAPLRGMQRFIRGGANAGAIVMSILLTIGVCTDFDYEWNIRLLFAATIMTGAAILAVAVLPFFNRRGNVKISAGDVVVSLVCPRCHASQSVPSGRSFCTHCGLRFELRFEEPTCRTCGYALQHVQSDRCPECGTVVAIDHAPSTSVPAR
jgi:hypothetical protein